MEAIRHKLTIAFLVTTSVMIGMVKGTEAKQKWTFKIKDRYVNRRHIAEQKSIARKGGVMLDDIELSSYHS